MAPRDALPAIRPLEVTASEGAGGRTFHLRDLLGVVPDPLALGGEAYLVASCLDGRRDVAGVRAEVRRLSGREVPAALVRQVAARLDAHGFLASDRYRALAARARARFRARPARPPACAGGCYPAEPRALAAFLDRLLDEAPGAAAPGELSLLVAPHVDPPRGRAVYGAAYRTLRAGAASCDTFVVFGTAHASPPHAFALTRKGYDTPLGAVEADVEVVDAIAGAIGEDEAFEDELVHAGEHSIEFQALFLRHLFGPRIRIVPVLCSLLPRAARELPVVDRFHDALAAALRGRASCVVAGADLCHVGVRFGDPRGPDAEERRRHQAEDLRPMGHAVAGDPDAFLADALADDDRRRLCGAAPVYHALRAAPGRRGALLAYGQAHDEAEGSLVGFAAAARYRA